MSTLDMSTLILAQITDLQRRVTAQDAIIESLKLEIIRLSRQNYSQTPSPHSNQFKPLPTPNRNTNRHVAPHGILPKPTIPLTPHSPAMNTSTNGVTPRRRPIVHSEASATGTATVPVPVALSAILNSGETVYIEAPVSRGPDRKFNKFATMETTFDGENLVVTACESIASLVGEKSDKPGTLLFKFFNGLCDAGVSDCRGTKLAPWKWCHVLRGDDKITLDALRAD
jgi:hypothetical protein